MKTTCKDATALSETNEHLLCGYKRVPERWPSGAEGLCVSSIILSVTNVLAHQSNGQRAPRCSAALAGESDALLSALLWGGQTTLC